MIIEKIEKNKIQIIISKEELELQKLSIQGILSGSSATQKLFNTILNYAENELNFATNNYSVWIETLALNELSLILTITRLKKDKPKRYTVAKRIAKNYFAYQFANFDDFYEFYQIIKFLPNFANSLYYFNEKFYFINILPQTNNLHLEYSIPSNLPSNLIQNFGKKVL